MIWLTSDLHLGHANIIKYCNRPFPDVHFMNKFLIDNWNELICSEDTVYCLGDFSFMADKYIKYLNGHIILIKGNHDKSRYDSLFEEVYLNHSLEINNIKFYLTHIPIEKDRLYKKGTLPDFNALDNYDYILSGHVHELWKTKGKHINVGVDVWDFKPVNINQILELIQGN